MTCSAKRLDGDTGKTRIVGDMTGRCAAAFDSNHQSSIEAAPTARSFRVTKTRFKMMGDHLVLGPDVVEARACGKSFTGAILDVTGERVVQSAGRGMAVIHDAERLDRVPAVGEAVCIMYHGNRGHVVELLQTLDRAQARD